MGQMRPRKIDDDLIDDLRAFATHRWPRRTGRSEGEREDARRPPHLRNAAIAKMTDHAQVGAAVMTQRYWDSERKKAERLKQQRSNHGGRFVNRYSLRGIGSH